MFFFVVHYVGLFNVNAEGKLKIILTNVVENIQFVTFCVSSKIDVNLGAKTDNYARREKYETDFN